MKKYLMEFIGTFFLTLTIAFTSGSPLAVGAVLIALVYMGGDISGGHYNPAVTLGAFVNKAAKFKDGVVYLIIQVLGAALAAFLFFVVQGDRFVPVPAPRYSFLALILIELLFTFLLTFVVLGVAVREEVKGNNYFGLAIGLALLAGISVAGAITGGVLNPAVALGTYISGFPKLPAGIMPLLGYLIGQFGGGLLAGLVFRFIYKDSKKKEEENIVPLTRDPQLQSTEIVAQSMLK